MALGLFPTAGRPQEESQKCVLCVQDTLGLAVTLHKDQSLETEAGFSAFVVFSGFSLTLIQNVEV